MVSDADQARQEKATRVKEQVGAALDAHAMRRTVVFVLWIEVGLPEQQRLARDQVQRALCS